VASTAHTIHTAQQIVAAYEQLATCRAGIVRISAIRAQLPNAARADVDAALREIADMDGAHLRAAMDQWNLTEQDRADALRLGGEDRHNLQLEWATLDLPE
jgi:hypothetical protein